MSRQREVVTIGVGQFGVQCSQEIWRLYALEHGIALDGRTEEDQEDFSFRTFFDENSLGQFVPRGLLLDLEPSVCEQVKNTDMKKFFDPEKIVYAAECGANVYARGRYVASKQIHPTMLTQVRKTIENCNALTFIKLLNAGGGGTGSGYTVRLSESIVDDLQFSKLMSFCLQTPDNISTSPTEYYNNLLYLAEGCVDGPIEYEVCFDNEALYRFVAPGQKCTYWQLNQLISFTASGLTQNLRYHGELHCDIENMKTNCVPFASLNQLLMTYSPLNTGKKKIDTKLVTWESFRPQNQFVSLDFDKSIYIACALLYRGRTYAALVDETLRSLKKDIKFVQWMPTGFKVGINWAPIVYQKSCPWSEPKIAVTKVCNHGAICQMIERYKNNCEKSYEYKAFFHHYLQAGMEEGTFTECSEGATKIIDQYVLAIGDGTE